jgi:hypothetical protein
MALAGIACLALAACGSPSLAPLPSGSYSNSAYGFHLTYPKDWKPNPYDSTPSSGDAASSAIPFTLVITRTGGSHSSAALISTFTVTVMNLKNSDIAKSAAGLASDKTLHAVTIGGVQGYASTPLEQDIPNTQISVTHIDYYVVHGNYEYQLSTDSVKGDDADSDLQNIFKSFAFGG